MLGAEPMPQRFPNLYDRDRWRRFGYPFLGLVVVGLAVGTIFGAQRNTVAEQDWLLASACGLGMTAALWLRQRFSYVQLQGERLLFRVLVASVRVELAEVRRTRAAKLVPALEGRARAPRSMGNADALVLRLRSPDTGRLRRVLGRRCVFDEEVVVPLDNPAVLSQEIEAALAPQRTTREAEAGRAAPHRRRRRK